MSRSIKGSVTALLLAGLLAACGSGTGPTQAPAASSGDGGGTAATPAAEATAGDGSGGSGASAQDMDALARSLVPPNSTETSHTTAPDTWFAIYDSTDSIASLKSFYEGAIAKTGLTVISTSQAGGGISWVFGNESGGGLSGVVNIYAGSDNKTSVQVSVGKS